MGVYIKGMEMPANCFLCPLSVLNENRLFCKATQNEVVRAKIDADCPIVPVPDHGDLIDRDARNEKDGWEMFSLITSTYYGKAYYFLQDDGLVYSRKSHKCMTEDAAISEFLDFLNAGE